MSDSTPSDGNPIVPFGKYKGQPVTELLKDRSYVEWVRLQAGMADRYPVVFNFIVGAAKPKSKRKKQDTPEHNAMQVRYLSEELRTQVASRYVHSDAELRPDRAPHDDRVYCLSLTPPTFEEHGWDVQYDAYVDLLPRDFARRFWSRSEHLDYRVIHLELKPSVSDDYPVVLRQVIDRRRRQYPNGYSGHFCRFLVITKVITPSSVTADEVRASFATQGIELLLTSEIEQRQVAA